MKISKALTFLLITFFSFISEAQVPSWMHLTTANSELPTNSIHNIVFDDSNVAWIGTWGAGLVKFDGKSWTVYDTANSPLPYNTIYSIVVDNNNIKWIGTFGGGLARFDGEKLGSV